VSAPAAGGRCTGGQGRGRGRRRGSRGTHVGAPRGSACGGAVLAARDLCFHPERCVGGGARECHAVCVGMPRPPKDAVEGWGTLPDCLAWARARPAPSTATHGECAERAGWGKLWRSGFVMVVLCSLLLVWSRLCAARAALACRCCGARGPACIPCNCRELSHTACAHPGFKWSVTQVARGADHNWQDQAALYSSRFVESVRKTPAREHGLTGPMNMSIGKSALASNKPAASCSPHAG
jgi:hypothetical protein